MTVPDDCVPPGNDARQDEQLSSEALSVIEDLKKIQLYPPPPGLQDKVITRIKEKKQSESHE